MQLKRCEQGHYYDSTKYNLCPHCEVYEDEDVGYTVAKVDEKEYQKPAGSVREAEYDRDDQATVGIIQRRLGVDPPTGWLVCVHGAAKGIDYRIRSERNTLGRSDRMDIVIKGDLGISRENHAIISYEPRGRVFSLIPGEGKSIIYLNGQEVLFPLKLSAYDRIEISDTILLFVPLCTEFFSWEDEEAQDA